MPKKTDTAHLESTKKASAEVNEAYTKRLAEILPQYAESISTDGLGSSEKLARRMSSEFNSLKFALVYEGGHSKLRVEPAMPRISEHVGPDYRKKFLEDLDKFWPSMETVRAFVQGYKNGSQETDRLREELDQLKKSKDHERHYTPFPFHPAMFRYFGG